MSADDDSPDRASTAKPWHVAVALFVVAWLARALAAASMPDDAWPHAIAYKGDAYEWLAAVASLRGGTPELGGLALRPPAMVWLVDLLWPDVTSSDVSRLLGVWRVLGALVAPCVYLAARRDVGEMAARAAGVLTAFATGPLLMSGAVESETPYLALVAAAYAVGLGDARRGTVAGLLHGAACLLRVEHLLVVALLGAWRARAADGRRAALALAVGFVVALVPWHLSAWDTARRVRDADAVRTPVAEAALSAVEARSAHVTWSDGAAAERDAWPAVVRRTAAAFVADTVRHRGGARVDVDDLAILDEAFGARPEAWSTTFFVSLYGPLNLALSIDPRAPDVGFSRAALDRPPPLVGGLDRYPRELVEGLPPAALSLDYLPHLALLAGRDVSPLDALGVAASGRGLERIQHAWRGAAMGWGGLGFPVGLTGVRGRVDLLVPDGLLAQALALVLALAAAIGAWSGGGRLAPWTLFVVAKLLTAAVAFGYARLGATAAPAVMVLAVYACATFWTERRVVLLGVALLVLELAATFPGVSVTIDGRPVGGSDPVPLSDHAPRHVSIRLGGAR